MKIAIYQSFPFHYEMFGFIINYCIKNNHLLTIYSENKNDMGWLKFYKDYFKFNDFRNINEFLKEAHIYDIVILTTDNDPNIKEYDLELYDIKDKIIKINHTNKNRNTSIKKYFNIRPYEDDNDNWCLQSYPMDNENKKVNKIPKIFISQGEFNRHDWKILNELNGKCKFYLLGRHIYYNFDKLKNVKKLEKVDTETMFKKLKKCDFFFYALSPKTDMLKMKISGGVSMAFSCGIPILTNEITNNQYKFKSAVIYKDYESLVPNFELVKKERDENIQNLDKILRYNYPNLFNNVILHTKIPKKINFLWIGDNNYTDIYNYNVETFRENNKDYDIKVWNEEEVIKLMKDNFEPKVYEIYENFSYIINKCDLARFCIIYVNGGVYSDLDFYCRRNLDTLLNDK